jgi:HAD superfamily hydrolase (TIGR01509 family)
VNFSFKKTVLVIASFLILTTSQILLSYNPEDTVVVLDIHDVLMDADINKIIGRFLKNPSLFFEIGHLINGSYGNNCKLRKIVNSQKPNKGVWELVSQLKRAGYPLYIFSNIDDRAFDELKAKFPSHFELFEDFHVVQENNKLHKKPARSSYESCKMLIAQKHPGKQIVFIDDKKKNTEAGKKAGFKTIHFSSAKKLKAQLKPLLPVTA